jgi:hypothetical protein
MPINLRRKNNGKRPGGESSENNAYSEAGYRDNSHRLRMQKSTKRIIASIVLILSVIFAGSFLFVTTETFFYTKNQTSDFISKANEIAADLKNNLAAKNDQFITDNLNTLFSKDDIYVFSYNLWSYGLYVNNTKVTSSSPLSINPGDTISVVETRQESSLPAAFISLGNLTRGDTNDSLSNHFAISKKTYKLTAKTNGLKTTYTVENLSLKSGETFNILLSVQLESRLGFERDAIVIHVR